MTIAYKDSVQETSTTTGTGAYTLNGAPSARYQTFEDAGLDGFQVEYGASSDDGFENGIGTITVGEATTLSRDVINASSNGGNAVNWGIGTRNIILTVGASRLRTLDENGNDVSGFGVSGGTGDAHTITFPNTLGGYSDGMVVEWLAPGNNTTNVTANVNDLGEKSYVRSDGSEFPAGSITTGSLQRARYDEDSNKFIGITPVVSVNGTSTTELTIETGEKAFTTQANRQWTEGQYIRAASDDGTKVMAGVVTSYSGTTLTLTVDYTEGTGTHADWNIAPSGPQGDKGDKGDEGDQGPQGLQGTASTSSSETDSFTLDLTQAQAYIRCNKATAMNVIVPPNSSVAFPVDTEIAFEQTGAGQVTFVEGDGVTIRTPETLKMAKQYATAAIKKVGTNEWVLSGYLEASS